MEHHGRSRLKTVTLLIGIGVCGTVLWLLQTAELRPNKEERIPDKGLYRNHQRMKTVTDKSTLNVPSLLPVTNISAKNSRWESLLNSTPEETTKPDPPVLPKMLAPLSGRGYVVALGFWEQLMGASKNLLHMQCWARTLGSGVSVVAPFLLTNKSEFGFSFASDSTDVSKLDLSALYDMTTWGQEQTKAGRLSPLVSREDLVREISQFKKLVVLVEVKHLSPSRDAKCDFTWNVSDVMKDLKQYQVLKVARNVCINLQRQINPSMFRSLVFGDLAPQDSLVIIKEWRGLGLGRVYTPLPSCHKGTDFHHLHLSDQVWKDAEIYVNRHLGGSGQFISISARFEKMSQKYGGMTVEQKRREIAMLIPQALSAVRELQRKHSMRNVHLSYDYGQYGSGTFRSQNYYNSEGALVKFQSDLYNGTVSFAEYEESYRELSSTNPAYVALVQIAVSSMGKCLVQIGWGHITSLIKELFMRTHQTPYCVKCITN